MPHQPIYHPGATRVGPSAKWGRTLTILEQDVEALLHEKSCVEDDEPEAEGENIVAGADFEEILDLFLCKARLHGVLAALFLRKVALCLQQRQGLSQFFNKEWRNDRGLGRGIDEVWYRNIICATCEIRSEPR